MKVALDQITASPTPLRYHEEAAALNARLHEGTHARDDFRFPQGLAADLEHYRAGLDVVFEGRIAGDAEGTCARCLEPYAFPLERDVHMVLVPRAAVGAEDRDDDVDLGFFEGEEIDVTALVAEYALLTLPTIPLCHEDCRGLCPQCGTNRNVRPCACVEEPARRAGGLAALAGMKIGHGSGGK